MIRLIAAKELRGLLHAPATWFILGALQLILAWSFLGRLDAYLQLQAQMALIANAPGATQWIVPGLSSTVALVMMTLTPVFTMRLLAEERRNQTLALLLASPLSARQIVLGKFFGLLLFLCLIIAAVAGMMLTLALGTRMDFGLLFANVSGLLLLTASYIALGLYISSLTAQPIVAAIGTLIASFALKVAEEYATDSSHALVALTPTGHFRNFNSGLLDSGDLAYFLLFCGFFLLLTMRRLDHNRIYG